MDQEKQLILLQQITEKYCDLNTYSPFERAALNTILLEKLREGYIPFATNPDGIMMAIVTTAEAKAILQAFTDMSSEEIIAYISNIAGYLIPEP